MWLWLGLLLSNVWAEDWESLGVTNGVHVYRRQETSGLFAFKGESTTDLSVAQIMPILRNESLGPEWVNMMIFSTVIEQYSETHNMIHQGYDLPWPASDRDYVFEKKVVYDNANKVATVHLTSVESAKVPVSEEFVRASGEKTFWRFSAEEGKTKIVVEVVTDPKGALPDWLVNSTQADWPHKSISSLIARAKKGDLPLDPPSADWQ